ncbi:MAG: hypothetical protein HQ546_05350 [Planctomycetes bacterium]|nr:hypothetical protein [Planctomycetota bacterium]
MVCNNSTTNGSIPMLPGSVETEDGHEVVRIGNLKIPVIGYVNCTGHPLPGDAENARRIQEFLDRQAGQDLLEERHGKDQAR